MTRYLLGRVLSLVASLLAASIIIFLILEVVPGDPAQFMLGLVQSSSKSIQYELMTVREWQHGFFARDRWNVTDKVTLDLKRQPVTYTVEGAIHEQLPLPEGAKVARAGQPQASAAATPPGPRPPGPTPTATR